MTPVLGISLTSLWAIHLIVNYVFLLLLTCPKKGLPGKNSPSKVYVLELGGDGGGEIKRKRKTS